ncbi:hypothetical protein [Ramlibacter pallidus]|uniref:DUF2844 domain-containing protein n=1 Tax=Ramlibacter pallidus TaxID=2780087 RepID=A0ABR9S597_9BURK|nr:hypothetical protein [Ramlibacter pallidus]MBE7368693.1 hypothetical protein [Ramlibacter pallidus]
MVFLNFITLVAAAMLLSACATNPPPAENLLAPIASEVISMPERASFVRLQGAFNVSWEYGLMPGSYVAEKENALGTFYRGAGRPIWARSGTTPAQLFAGGIWVPKNASDVPRLYIIRDNVLRTTSDLDQYSLAYSQNRIASGQPVGPSVTGSVIGGAIVGAILQAEAGTIYIHEPSGDPTFDNRLKTGYESRSPNR